MPIYKIPVLKQITINCVEETPTAIRDIYIYVNVEVDANSFPEAWAKYMRRDVLKKEYGEVVYRDRK